jgi:hypothetical protein
MRRILGLALIAPVVLVACNRQPEPAPAPLPVMSAGEQACIDRAAATTAVDPATITIVPSASTKSGATIYTVTAGGVSYSCVAELDGTVSGFSAL